MFRFTLNPPVDVSLEYFFFFSWLIEIWIPKVKPVSEVEVLLKDANIRSAELDCSNCCLPDVNVDLFMINRSTFRSSEVFAAITETLLRSFKKASVPQKRAPRRSCDWQQKEGRSGCQSEELQAVICLSAWKILNPETGLLPRTSWNKPSLQERACAEKQQLGNNYTSVCRHQDLTAILIIWHPLSVGENDWRRSRRTKKTFRKVEKL